MSVSPRRTITQLNTHNMTLRTILLDALHQRPIIGDGAPVDAEHIAHRYEMPVPVIADALECLVREGAIVRSHRGYQIAPAGVES
jgi:DNA-binding GntR family transcriptional regulator